MSKNIMFALVFVLVLWLEGMVSAEDPSSMAPTPLPQWEPTPLPTPDAVQTLQPMEPIENGQLQPEMTQALHKMPEETPLGEIQDVHEPVELRRAPLTPEEQGESKQFKAEDSEGNYAFGYVEDHNSGGSFRREIADKTGRVEGYYGLRDADGRVRIVAYVADEDGFRADIQTNEPGFEVLDPASTTINKGKPVAAANPLTYDRVSGKGEFD